MVWILPVSGRPCQLRFLLSFVVQIRGEVVVNSWWNRW